MEQETPPYDVAELEAMNEKAIQNQLFTPDQVYIDLSLMKDIPLGILYADLLNKGVSKEIFDSVQQDILKVIPDYQKRTFDTVDPYLGELGYTDDTLQTLLHTSLRHDSIFSVAPTTKFFNMLIRHTMRNQNNSLPAKKYTKRQIDKDRYVMEPVPVTYYINTYPLNLSVGLLTALAKELGESFGVNIQFLNKSPSLFDKEDWDHWMEKIDCFYLNSIGEFTRSPFILEKQGELAFMGCYFFVRKRFEKSVMDEVRSLDFDQQIQMATARISMLCDFSWLQNNDTRLTEEGEDIPMDEPQT